MSEEHITGRTSGKQNSKIRDLKSNISATILNINGLDTLKDKAVCVCVSRRT